MKKELLIIRLNWVDLVTLSGVLTSSFAVVLAFQGKYSFSLAFLFVAMISDAMDGFLARHFKLERPFGRYLDSFIDVMIYLSGPAILCYFWGFNTWYYNAVLVLFMMSGVVRLSVFNEIGNIKEEGSKKLGYLGMPVFWSLFILGFFYILTWFIQKEIIFPFLAAGFLAFAFLMIYNAPFFKFKSWKILLFICIFCALVFGARGVYEMGIGKF